MFSRILRRVHMYAALFMVPWVLMYAVSTIVMNHQSHLGGAPAEPEFERVSQGPYQGSLPANATPHQIALQLLDDLGMPGRKRLRVEKDTGKVVVTRDTINGPRRITYEPANKNLIVEKANFGPRTFLAQAHRRRGWDHGTFKDSAWALSVDAFIVGMLFWTFSGLWMWWEIRVARGLGWVSLASGAVLFAVFLVAI